MDHSHKYVIANMVVIIVASRQVYTKVPCPKCDEPLEVVDNIKLNCTNSNCKDYNNNK